MFKNLKKKLQSFEADLESALEDELEKQLEKELADAVDAELGTDVAPEVVPDATPAVAPDEPEPPEPTPEPEPEPEPEPPEPRPEPEPEPEPRPEPEPEPEPKPEPEPDRPQPDPLPAKQPETPKPTPAPQPPAVPVQPVAATPIARERVRKPGGPVKKTDAELKAEIEASLAAELSGAVEAQHEVETVIGSSRQQAALVRLSDERLDDLLWELEVALLESDVALPVVEAIKNNVRDQLREARIPKKGAGAVVQQVLRTAVRRVLNEPFDFDAYIETAAKPVVIMFIGVNGTGKTTAIAKTAFRLKQKGKSVVMAAGDTFRAGAVAQLQQHADRLGVKMIKHEGKNADPAAVAFDAIDHAKSRHKDVVLLDTAGRMGTNTNLMDEMEKIKRVAQPDLIFFVGDSLAGNDAVSQADKFNDVCGIDGVILTKVDADAKGGAALSVAYAIGKPLVFIGLGQEYEDQVPFDRDWMLDRLFGGEEEEVAAAA